MIIYIIIFSYNLITTLLKNAGLNTTQCWVKYGQTQRLGYWLLAEGWVKHFIQLLVENNPIAGFVHI